MSIFSKLFGKAANHTTDSPELIRKNIAEGKALMLDVRSQEEWDAGHLKEVIFISFSEIKSLPAGLTEVANLDKSKIVYCH